MSSVAGVATRYGFSSEQYHRMACVGIFTEDTRVELIDGDIIEMSPVGSLHVACVNRLDDLLHDRLARRSAIVQVQSPVTLDERYEPEPDVTVLRYRPDYYARALPTAADVLLLIEVADSSLPFDQGTKLPLYARAGIPEVWIVDLDSAVIERHAEPTGDTYVQTDRTGPGSTVSSTTVPAIALQVNEVLGGIE
jgi:Uma2 family endonuclease